MLSKKIDITRQKRDYFSVLDEMSKKFTHAGKRRATDVDQGNLPPDEQLRIIHNWAPDGRSGNLSGFDLQSCDLRGIDLAGASLDLANLHLTNLRGADLSHTSLTGANLSEADLSNADLEQANLKWADLRGANLYKANLSNADLRGADLKNTKLDRANLRGIKIDESTRFDGPLQQLWTLAHLSPQANKPPQTETLVTEPADIDTPEFEADDTVAVDVMPAKNKDQSDTTVTRPAQQEISAGNPNGKGDMPSKESENIDQETGVRSSLLWFVWGVSLSMTMICALSLLVMVIGSVALNAYLGWQLAGYEVVIRRPQPGSAAVAPVPPPNPVAAVPPTPVMVEPTPALNQPVAAPDINATGTAMAVVIGTQIAADVANTVVAVQPTVTATPLAQTEAQSFVPPATSSNRYDLIQIKGNRESRPAAEHGDHNLKLRDPQPTNAELTLIDYPGGIDPNAPKLNSVFDPEFAQAYTVHNWDWGCNCKGELLQRDDLVVLGIKTQPGQPIFIPKSGQPVFGADYFATVLYAADDTLTFVYDNVGNVTTSYTIHYLGLQTDPNLVKLFEESQGNQLPGLKLDTPVGIATGSEVIVAIRDKGTFMDARSRKDWWE